MAGIPPLLLVLRRPPLPMPPRIPLPLFALLIPALASAAPEPVRPLIATADSERPGAPASLAVDGRTDANSRWLSLQKPGPHRLELRLSEPRKLGGLHVFSGYDDRDPVTDFSVQFFQNGAWVDIPSAAVEGNRRAAVRVLFDDTVDVSSDRIRIVVTNTPGGSARVAEIVVWPYSADGVPPVGDASSAVQTPAVFLNQSGFNRDAPKRFTVPGVADGVEFAVRPAGGGGGPEFRGAVKGETGDFSGFKPEDARDYVVVVDGQSSVPFRIGPWWLERISYQGSIDFMIDSRHYHGTHRTPRFASYGWRDDHYFGWELNALVAQWLSNPSAYARMPRQIRYEAPRDPSLWGRLEPPAPDAPDIVKLIHWGADVIVTQGTTHEMLKAQLAYFLHAWPALSDYLPEQNRRVVSEFAFGHWTDPTVDRKYHHDESPEHDLLALKTKIGSTKGGYPPGFSIEPNVLMHQVASREGRPDAERHLAAAVRQAEWIVRNLDWEDPLTTKGQRISEFATMTGLARLLTTYPDRAPAGLREKINHWAKVVIRRSDNLWDFRKLGDAPDQWVPVGPKPHMWNEVGNVVGLPAAILAAKPFVDDPAVAARLDEILWAHFDAMFGRNPTGRPFGFSAAKEIEGVEHGWFSRYQGGNGQLEEARFVLDGSPKNAHYPRGGLVGDKGWSEGWIQHNTPFNLSLAYLARATTRLEARIADKRLVVKLRAPLNFDYARAESGVVTAAASSGDRETLVVTETGPSADHLIGVMELHDDGPAKSGDGRLWMPPGGSLSVSYGFEYLGRSVTLNPSSGEG